MDFTHTAAIKETQEDLTMEKLMASMETLKKTFSAVPPDIRFVANLNLTVTKTEQTFIPRSKKKRIVKKCLKKYRITWEEPDPNMYSLGEGVFVAHPETMRQASEALETGVSDSHMGLMCNILSKKSREA